MTNGYSIDNLNIIRENDTSSDDDEFEENIYEGDDISPTKFNIGLCELYNDKIHGNTHNYLVKSGFLLICRFKSLHIDTIRCYIQNWLHNLRNAPVHLFKHHAIIRNYPFLYLKMYPEIMECHYLDTGEIMCVKKTIWIKLIQRTWQNIYKKRQAILIKRRNIQSLKHKEINGKWPANCSELPTINGMLRYLVI